MKEANHLAAVEIFEKVNASLLPQNVLDLHGLHVDEAIEHLMTVLQQKTEGRTCGNDRFLIENKFLLILVNVPIQENLNLQAEDIYVTFIDVCIRFILQGKTVLTGMVINIFFLFPYFVFVCFKFLFKYSLGDSLFQLYLYSFAIFVKGRAWYNL